MHALLLFLFLMCLKCMLLLEKTSGCGKVGQLFTPFNHTLYQLAFYVTLHINIIPVELFVHF